MSDERAAEALDLPEALKDDKVVVGHGGRLFLANDANNVLAQHSGELRFSDTQLNDWRELLETRTAWLEEHGARHYFLIAPNSHSVYPDMLPSDVTSARERPVHQLLAHLREHGPGTRVVYPLESLFAQREHAYAKTGSHWNGVGAFVATQALVDEIRRDLPLEVASPQGFEFVQVEGFGDLGAKLTPPVASAYVRADPRDARARLVSDNRVKNTGRRVLYESDRDDGPECLVYGDSFAMRVLQFLAESFRRLTFVHMVNLDRDLVLQLRPDVVVKVMSERFLISVPVDDPAKTQVQLEAEKVAAGEVLPPRRHPPRPGRPLSLAL